MDATYIANVMLIVLLNFFVFLNTAVECHFGYTGYEQRKWHKNHRSCAGLYQSPIQIESHKAKAQAMPALEMVRYHDLLPGPITLHNNGHSVSVSIGHRSADDPRSRYVPYIFGAKLSQNEYVLEGLHFHWGEYNDKGSEHTFNGVRYPMEMHVIHRNRKYRSVAHAQENRDGLTVLAFFFQLRQKENRHLTHIIRALSHVEAYNSSYELPRSFMLADILPEPDDMDQFYTYKGSLTTPPCSEAVTWILFPNPLPISVHQMDKFRNLEQDERKSPLFNNYRHIQKLGSRRVFVRIVKSKNSTNGEPATYSDFDYIINNEIIKTNEVVNEDENDLI